MRNLLYNPSMRCGGNNIRATNGRKCPLVDDVAEGYGETRQNILEQNQPYPLEFEAVVIEEPCMHTRLNPVAAKHTDGLGLGPE